MKHAIREELAKLKKMTFTEKRQHIWMYYKVPIISAPILLYMLWSLANVWFIDPAKDSYLYVAWLSAGVSDSTLAELGEQLSVIVADPGSQAVQVTHYGDRGNRRENIDRRTRFNSFMYMGTLDLFVVPHTGIYDVAAEGFIRPIHGVMHELRRLNPGLYDKLQSRQVTITYTPPTLRDDIHPPLPVTDVMAVSLAGSPLLEALGINTSDMYASVVFNSENFYAAAKALGVLFYDN